MTDSGLPAHPSLEYLKKLAKERLRALRETDPHAKLADAQRALAREHGFASWRALRAEVEQRSRTHAAAFVAACNAGDVTRMNEFLQREPALARVRTQQGFTPLHAAARHPDAIRLLLQHGADPNARDDGDNALPLHVAAGGAPIESVRLLVDAGSDVHGRGDAHALDVIGWAACFAEPRRDIIELLRSRGAEHHVFSAIATGEHAALRALHASDPKALQRRLSRHEQEQTALHYCVAPPDGLVGGLFRTGEHYHTLELLLALGAEVEAVDAKGRTPLELAMLRGDAEAMRLLHAAGARVRSQQPGELRSQPADLAASVSGLVPMLAVPDIDAAVAWYRAIGFTLAGSNGNPGELDWAEVALGRARIMFASSGDAWRATTQGIALWLYTDRIDELYAALKQRQLERAAAVLRGEAPVSAEIRFRADLYTTFYGMREFSIEDPNGIDITFAQPA